LDPAIHQGIVVEARRFPCRTFTTRPAQIRLRLTRPAPDETTICMQPTRDCPPGLLWRPTDCEVNCARRT
jgi:hypothetical protein